MAKNSILLAVADPQALVDITQALGADWEASSVSTEAAALEQLEQHSFGALLVDFNLGSPDASDLLNLAHEKCPETVRFLLAYEADLALVAAKVLGPHQILPKPIDAASLQNRIDEGVAPDDAVSRKADAAAVPTPQVPPVYEEVLKVLDSPTVTVNQVGAIISQDAELVMEILDLSNSSYFGLPRNIIDPVEAVDALGLTPVKTLLMARRFLTEHSQLKPGYLSFDQLWQHSKHVARIARDLMLFETKDRQLAAEALTAGLVHDLGKVVLVMNFDDLYGRVHSLARKQPVPLWDIEKEMFGANHGEIGACLAGMWNLPLSIVEATASHHEPSVVEDQQLTPLAAVHIANVLEHELRPSDECRVAPILSTPFLNQLGLLQRLPVWRAALGSHSLAKAALVESAEPQLRVEITSARAPRTANRLAGPATPTRSATSEQPGIMGEDWKLEAHRRRQRRWIYSTCVAGPLLLLAVWLGTRTEPDQPVPIYARTPVAVPNVTALSPSPEPAPAVLPEATPTVAVSEQPSPTSKSPGAEVPAPLPWSEPSPVIAYPPAPATVPSAPPPPAPKPQPEFRLNGIIYNPTQPSAIVNGATVYVGDHVHGATVLAISRTSVLLQVNGVRKIYMLN